MTLLRRTLIGLALFGALAGVGGGVAQAAPDDRAMGSARAKVTVIEYASVTCPHCAHWNETVFPAFKKKYIDTGKVRFVLRELPTPPVELATAGFLVARCSGPKYFTVVDALWKAQPALIDSGDTRGWLLAGAAAGGLTEAQAQACLSDQAAIDALTERAEANAREYDVQGTPTFVVDGRKLEGAVDLASLDAAISGSGKVKKGPMTFFGGLFKKKPGH